MNKNNDENAQKNEKTYRPLSVCIIYNIYLYIGKGNIVSNGLFQVTDDGNIIIFIYRNIWNITLWSPTAIYSAENINYYSDKII